MHNSHLKKIPILRTFECSHIGDIYMRSLDTTITRREKIALRFHTAMCGICRATQKTLQNIRHTLRNILEQFDFANYRPLTTEQKNRLNNQLENHIQAAKNNPPTPEK